jgi:hypothetical protein
MGLNSYLYSGVPGQRKKYWDNINKPGATPPPRELAYRRKHSDLHGWMFQRWQARYPGGHPDDFNCVEFELTWDDITALEKAVTERSLPETNGFFFGSGKPERYRAQDLEFCQNAKADIFLGIRVFYLGSW